MNARSPDPEGLSLTEDVVTLLLRSRRYLWTSMSRCLEARGEAVLAFRLLACLVWNGPRTQRELAEATAQHPAGVSRLLDELERQRLVRRHRDENDRRRVVVEASERGRERVAAARPEMLVAVDRAMRGLSRAERQALQALLRKMLAVEDCEPAADDERG